MNFIFEDNRIYMLDNKDVLIAEITFPKIDEDTVDINHTFVDASLRGQGVASKLVEAAYKVIKEQNKKAMLTCSYAVKWFESHQSYQDILK